MGIPTSVVVITLNRPDYVRTCLQRLQAQQPRPDQVIVVDSSQDDRTTRVVAEFPGVLYLRNENGFGRMTTSRNIALKHCTGAIIAFVDDDAFAHAGWLAALLAAYTDPKIGAVGGRALNNQPGEEKQGVDRIGRLMPYGDVQGNFAADPGAILPVDHIMGCNMSFRREVLARLGGFREDFPGISGVCEDTDMSLRVRKMGYTILFNPAAVVDHVAAPQAIGKRFDTRYSYNAQRNRLVMLISNYGPFSGYVWRYIFHSLWRDTRKLGRIVRGIGPFADALAHWGANTLGSLVGMVLGVRLLIRHRADPVRHDRDAQEIARILGRSVETSPLRPTPIDEPQRATF
ncbi:MAG TPA: glycosyltransferase [Chthonomonadaceae bacterium]|nr:glycosyltransferase [Chthonomonadaceae bacterium]